MAPDEEFDFEQLRSLDRPRTEDSAVVARLRDKAMTAFDDAVASSTADLPLPERPRETRRNTRPALRYIAVAAAAVALVIGTFSIWDTDSPDQVLDVASPNAIVVANYCNSIVDEIDIVHDYLVNGEGTPAGALDALLEIAEELFVAGRDLEGEPFVRSIAPALALADNANALKHRGDSIRTDEIATLANTTARTIDDLPAASVVCDLSQLRSP